MVVVELEQECIFEEHFLVKFKTVIIQWLLGRVEIGLRIGSSNAVAVSHLLRGNRERAVAAAMGLRAVEGALLACSMPQILGAFLGMTMQDISPTVAHTASTAPERLPLVVSKNMTVEVL